MTVFQELVKAYDANEAAAGKFDTAAGYTLLPLGHVSVKVEIEVAIDQQGNFLAARALPKDEQLTVIPATIDAATRASNPEAFPLHDKVKYCAGDLLQYAKTAKNKRDFETAHQKYLDLLTMWASDPQTPSEIGTILKYIQKNRLVSDLAASLSDKKLIQKVEKGEPFVRFRVDNPGQQPPWRDTHLFKAWTEFYLAEQKAENDDLGIDYITGDKVPTTKKIEKNVNALASNAKLISANDNANFSYRGIFLNDDFYSVGYAQSQKMTHALKWLIQRQGIHQDSRVFLFWTNDRNNETISDAVSTISRGRPLSQRRLRLIEKEKKSLEKVSDTGQEVAYNYRRRLKGMLGDIEVGDNHPVNVLFLDAATTGRMSVAYYDLLQTDVLKANLERWGNQAAFIRNFGGEQRIVIPNFSQVLRAAYSTGHTGERFNTVAKRAMTRLMVAVIHGRSVPSETFNAIYRHVRHPKSYDHFTDWYRDLIYFSAVQNYNSKGATGMSLDKNNHDRSYVYGRLLSVADTVERTALYQLKAQGANQSDRETTALRFFTNFSERPATTWKRVWLAVVRSYLNRLSGGSRTFFLHQVDEITNLMPPEEFESDEPLSTMFLSGFSAQNEANHMKTTKQGGDTNDK